MAHEYKVSNVTSLKPDELCGIKKKQFDWETRIILQPRKNNPFLIVLTPGFRYKEPGYEESGVNGGWVGKWHRDVIKPDAIKRDILSRLGIKRFYRVNKENDPSVADRLDAIYMAERNRINARADYYIKAGIRPFPGF